MAKKAAKKATKKPVAKSSTKKSAPKREMCIVGSKAKLALKGSGKQTFNVSSDTLEALNNLLYNEIEKAQARCSSNSRKTIRGKDF